MRRAPVVVSMFLPLLVGACVYTAETQATAPATLAPPPVKAAAAPAPTLIKPTHINLTATLPDAASEGLPPAVLDGLTDGVPVRLDLTFRPPLEPSFIQQNGAYVPAESCDFGAVPASGITLPTGSNHMLLDVELGSRDSHPANLLSCEYDPGALGTDDPPAVWRLRGCFLPYEVSIPTALVWALNPLPARACGIGD